MHTFVRDNIFKTSQNRQTPERAKLFKYLVTQGYILLSILIILLCLITYNHQIQSEYNDIQADILKRDTEIKEYISIDEYADTAINDINEINLTREETTPDAFFQRFNNIVSYIAYYHKIYHPINADISNVTSSSNISPINISLKLKAQEDQSVFQFTDSLILNLQGFSLIKRIEIQQEKDYLSGEIEFEWYTAKNIKDACECKLHKKIIPSKSPYSVEEECSISVWQGNILKYGQ